MSAPKKATWTSGGTSHILPEERARASFNVRTLQEYWAGGSKRLHDIETFSKIFDALPLYDKSDDHFLSRKELYLKSLKRSTSSYGLLRTNKELYKAHVPRTRKDGNLGKTPGMLMESVSHNFNSLHDHFGLFVTSILSLGSQEQIDRYLMRAIHFKIIGCYGQTELGHGSNIRGLETTATYDEQTEEFIIDSNTLTGRKWWPGSLGMISTHMITFAQLIINGKNYGFHSFMVQLRDEKHNPLPGVEVGDIGPKMGFTTSDSGFCSFKQVRIPRNCLMSKYNKVTADGEYVAPPKKLSKIGYIMMTRTRAGIIRVSADALGKAATIATRYAAVRRQGFKKVKAKDPFAHGEVSVLDYQYQQHRILSAISMAYTIYHAARHVFRLSKQFENLLLGGDMHQVANALPELHATTAGLKSWCTLYSIREMETCRQTCGGQGYTLSGGIPTLINRYIPSITYEGDQVLLALQLARYLLKQHRLVGEGKSIPDRVSYLAGRVGACPVRTKADLRDLDKLTEVLRVRARRSVDMAAKVFNTKLAQSDSYDDAWNSSQMVLVRASEHHCQLFMLEAFATRHEDIKVPECVAVFRRMATLFGLNVIRNANNGEWDGSYFSDDTPRHVVETISYLLTELRPDAVTLVDGFGFHDQALNSCIGRHDGNVYEALVDWSRRAPFNTDKEFQDRIYKDFLGKRLDKDFLRKRAKL